MSNYAEVAKAALGVPRLEKEPEGWLKSPILDDWRWALDDGGEKLHIDGAIYGHGVVGNGKHWTTGEVVGIDPKDRFATTRDGRVYRLGWPHQRIGGSHTWPPILKIATCSNWIEAAEIALHLTGAHTLPGKLLGFIDASFGEGAGGTNRRNAADRVASALYAADRSAVAAAWLLLSCDLRVEGDRIAVADTIELAVRDIEREQERECTTAETVVTAGWLAVEGPSRAEIEKIAALAGADLDDPIALAHRVGALVGLLPQKRPPPPVVDALFVSDAADDGGKVRTATVLEAVGFATTERGNEVVRALKPIVGKALPLVPVPPDLDAVGRTLRGEFPYVAAQIDAILSDLIGADYCRLRPTLFVGEPGGGKSRLVRRLAEMLGLRITRFDGAGAGDNSFGGTGRRWHSAEASVPVRAMCAAQAPTAVVLIDEIDKCGTSPHNGSFAHSLLGFLEQETARRYPDPYADAEVDCSYLTFLATANDVTVLPAPLRDRFRIVRLPPPRRDDLPAIARTIVADLRRERGGNPNWLPDLDADEIEIAERLWRGGSLRRLREIVSRILVHRANLPRH